MAQAATTTATPMTDSTTATPKIVFEMHEQILASTVLYGMTLLCVIWGSIRSLKYIKKCINKKEKIEASISTNKAFKFPITASIVLFSLYLLFKCDAECRSNAFDKVKQYAPEDTVKFAVEKYEMFQEKFSKFLPKESVQTDEEKAPVTACEKVKHFVKHNVKPLLNKENLMFALLVLLCYEGSVALANLFHPFFSKVFQILSFGKFKRKNYRIKFDDGTKEMNDDEAEDAPESNWKNSSKIHYDNYYIYTLILFSLVGLRHVLERHWITNNLIGVAFSIIGIEMLHLSSFKAGCILLTGLFFYDIFWVFGTEVMTTVAKNIDAPILLQFPQDILREGIMANKHSMIGLGDIVIPGIFIALIYRFDNRDYLLGKEKARKCFYFFVTIIAYAIGLLITMAVMHFFKAAQPALLYLVPCCIIIPFTIAHFKGDSNALWNYNEERFVDPEKNKKDEKKTN
uniref:Intramembrane protease 2 (inferred by orthology to a C. elegans protein) n=1 Tax=Strongyloides venezuelensis TaxID=75913 RepID=A0A0K0F3M1_STRVS